MHTPKIPGHVKEVAKVKGVTFYAASDHSYVCFVADLDICNDGTGKQPKGDPHWQPRTAYNPYLSAETDLYIVVPPQIRKKCKKKVLGCKARLTNLVSGAFSDAVCGEVGPANVFGEAAYCLAKIINPKVTRTSGDKAKVYFYELWPGVAAPGYKLQ